MLKKLLTIASLIFLTSCVETVLIGSAATGTLVVRDKTIVDTKKDIVISATIITRFVENGLKNPGNSIDVMVNEGRVLLVGLARDPDRANMASEIAWKVHGVKEVIDEIQLAKDSKLRAKDFPSAFRDYVITAEIDARLFFAKHLVSVNYKVATVNGVVYLLGLYDSEDEMQKVLSIASKVKGVKKVVNHLISVNDARRIKQ